MIIDSHCHLDFSEFDIDREQVLQRALQADISKIIIPGVTCKNWYRISKLCDESSELYACYGLHPYFIGHHQPSHLDELKQYTRKHKPIAIGECGLDFFLKNLNKEKQYFYFEQQLDIALEVNLPVVIHARKSTEAVILAIKKHPGIRGVIHSYSGSYEQAKQLIELGFYLGFGGPVTYNKSIRLHKLIQLLPLESILVETDAPNQPVSGATHSRNEPACIVDAINSIAKLKQVDADIVISATAENTCRCFNL